MSAAEVAASEVATSEMPTPTAEVAASTASTSEVPAGKSGHRRTRYRNAEQQGSDDPNQSRARHIHSPSLRRTAAVLGIRAPAIELDAPRADVFKLTWIKTR